MSAFKSQALDYRVIKAAFCDARHTHESVFSTRNLTLTLSKLERRIASEGFSFLTKTLPTLGKAFDKALSREAPLDSTKLRFCPQPGSKLPKFLGELFNCVLDKEGNVLQNPCVQCVGTIRQLLYLFYKYELPYSASQEQQVIDRFKQTEADLSTVEAELNNISSALDETIRKGVRRSNYSTSGNLVDIVREARIHLQRAFALFDPYDIYPRHGPGAVATRQQLWNKFRWVNISKKITDRYPIDAYFFASAGAFCDHLRNINSIGEATLPARVLLVPKDSRGPRLISCEPVDFQWIQQGLGRAIVEHIEKSEYTKYSIFFTDQGPNQRGALLGSSSGRYSTLDLNEASDRVSLSLVRLLFPPHIYECMEACRSEATLLPTGEVLKLRKFAPMGSALCFPTMALTIWALLRSAAPDADTSDSILVYGDDVIVPTAFAACAMNILESFGLKINRDKSCTQGSFRESCGTDAFKGINVTPVRLRTVWEESPSPEVFTSWVAYANQLYKRKYFNTYDEITRELYHYYGRIPAIDMNLSCPSLIDVPENHRPNKRRLNPNLQKLEYKVLDVLSTSIHYVLDGWSSLLRYFSLVNGPSSSTIDASEERNVLTLREPVSVSSYTRRHAVKLAWRWR